MKKLSRLRWSQRRLREPMVSIMTDMEAASPITASIPFRMRLPCFVRFLRSDGQVW